MTDANCTICDELVGISHPVQGDYASIVEAGHHILGTIDRISCIPSLGPLNAFHLMLVPQFHLRNIASLPLKDTKAVDLFRKLITLFNLNQFSIPTSVFEHGTGNSSDIACACIEHAHLHVLGTHIDLTPLLLEHYDFRPLSDVGDAADSGYYYYQHGDNPALICLQHLEPQFFRIMHWRAMRSWSPWNWRLFHNVAMVRHVIDNYSSLANHLHKKQACPHHGASLD